MVELDLVDALLAVVLSVLPVTPRLWSRLSRDDAESDGGGGGADMAEVLLPDWFARFDTYASNSDLLIEPVPLVSIALKSLSIADVSELDVLLPDWFARFDTYASNSDLLIEPVPLVSIALKSWSAAVVVPVAESSWPAS